jgi:NAD(P)-dependent dehydrogenase (short-subunit alcohol dehydrogenase family)
LASSERGLRGYAPRRSLRAMTDNRSRYAGIAGRTAVVTGGSRGIGAEIARVLAAQGASVVVSGRDAAALDSVVDEIAAAGGTAHAVVADVTDAAALAELRTATETTYGPADLLAVVAGGGGRPSALADVTPEVWRAGLEANLTSVFLTLREFLPGMKERGRGAIVTMSSSSGRLPYHPAPQYAAAKAGLLMLTREAAHEAGPAGVRVNALAPAMTMNDAIRANMPEQMLARAVASFPLGRIGTPTDTAEAATFLLSDAASWITGVTLDVAGGQVMV